MIEFHAGSFKDPDGRLFRKERVLYRGLSFSFKEDYEYLHSSGLYQSLIESNDLVLHEEVLDGGKEDFYLLVKPQEIPFVSYPFEWGFEQWKDAALLTLSIMKRSLEKGMIIKDASCYNIIFEGNAPKFIDLCSFKKYQEGEPWVAYRQFIEHFLGPLLLSKYYEMDANSLFHKYPNGIPLPVISSLLPFKSWFHSLALFHIHLFNASSGALKDKAVTKRKISPRALMRILNDLEFGIHSLRPKTKKTTWNSYYELVDETYLNKKKNFIETIVKEHSPNQILDIAANTGLFSFLCAPYCNRIIASDLDILCVENIYKTAKQKRIKNLYALQQDVTHLSPAKGIQLKEYPSFIKRNQSDLLLALAVTHHLYFSNHISFETQCAIFYELTQQYLIVEYISPNDAFCQLIIKDFYSQKGYTKQDFEDAFATKFHLLKSEELKEKNRYIYLFVKK